MEELNENIGMLFTGGLESTTLLDYSLRNTENYFHLLYIKVGYRWEDFEYQNSKNIIEYYKEIYPDRIKGHSLLDLSNVFKLSNKEDILNLKDNILPMRNLSLLTNAALFFHNININKITFGIQGSEEYPDTSKTYFNQLKNLIQLGLEDNEFDFIMPFYGKSKEEVIGLYDNEFPISLIFSCTKPINNKKCGYCYKCQQLDKVKKDFFHFFF